MKKSLAKFLSAVLAATLFIPSLLGVPTASAQDGALVVYTNSLDDEKEAWLTEKVKEAGFNVTFVTGGGGEIYDRIMAEANDPQADVAIGMDEGQWSLLNAKGLIAEWEPSWKDDLQQDLITGDGYYYPWAEQRILAYYNPETLDAEQAPKTLEEMGTREDLQGKYLVPGDFGGSTNQKIVFSILLQHLDENGEYGVSDEGWQAVEAFLHNGHKLGENEDKHALFVDGVVDISYHFSGGIPNAEKSYGFTVVPINPEYGVFTMSEQVGLIKKGDDHDYTKAQEFAEWWGSEEIQRAWVEAFGTVPANTKVQDAVDPRIQELFEATDRMDVDWDVYNEYLSDWVEKIELELMPL